MIKSIQIQNWKCCTYYIVYMTWLSRSNRIAECIVVHPETEPETNNIVHWTLNIYHNIESVLCCVIRKLLYKPFFSFESDKYVNCCRTARNAMLTVQRICSRLTSYQSPRPIRWHMNGICSRSTLVYLLTNDCVMNIMKMADDEMHSKCALDNYKS